MLSLASASCTNVPDYPMASTLSGTAIANTRAPAVGHPGPAVLSIITDGGLRFDRRHLEDPSRRPEFPLCALYCNELTGAGPEERGRALLAEIRQRKAAGEFSPFVPTLVFTHGEVVNGELMLTDAHGSFRIPATVLLEVLASASGLPASMQGRPAPVVLSCCMAEHVAASLQGYARPVLINGSRRNLSHLDAEAVFGRVIYETAQAWQHGRSVDTDQLFDALSRTSGEPVHRIEQDDWLTHHVLTSVTSLDEINAEQEVLYLIAKLSHGSVEQLAEAVLLFGTEPLHSHFHWSPADARSNPVLWHLVLCDARDLPHKLVLLLALGEQIDQTDQAGNTLLHDVCLWEGDDELPAGDELMARLLLANGANPLAENDGGITPVDLAEGSGNEELIAVFRPDADTDDYPDMRPAGLLARAEGEGWGAVATLLRQALARPDPSDQSDQPDHAGNFQMIENSDS